MNENRGQKRRNLSNILNERINNKCISGPSSVYLVTQGKVFLTGFSSVTSHSRYSATCIIWEIMCSSSCGETTDSHYRHKNTVFTFLYIAAFQVDVTKRLWCE